jgi:hypothetical protein
VAKTPRNKPNHNEVDGGKISAAGRKDKAVAATVASPLGERSARSAG